MSATARNIMRNFSIAAWLCIAIQSSAADTVTLRYGQIPSTVRSVSTLYLFIAQQKGFLAREGVKLELVPIAGGTDKMVAALDRGAVDVTQTATPYLIRAALSGSDATAIAGETANPVYSLMVKPQIQSFAELRGKTLGLSLPVDTISISMRKLLALNGLGEGDYSVKAGRRKELMPPALRSSRGECDAVRPVSPTSSAMTAGTAGSECRRMRWRRSNSRSLRRGERGRRRTRMRLYVSCVERGAAWRLFRQGTGGHAGALRMPQARRMRRGATRSARGLHRHWRRYRRFRFIHDPANRGEVATAIVELTGSSDQIARQTLALYFEPDRGVVPKQAEIDLKGLAQVIAFMGEGGAINITPPLPQPERFVDLQYLRAAGAQ